MMIKKSALWMLIIALTFGCFFNGECVKAAEYSNVALGKKVIASSEYSASYSPENAVDGIQTTTSWSPGSTVLNGKSPDGYKSWIIVDLGGTYFIDHITTYSRTNGGGAWDRTGWIYEVSNDAGFANWIRVGKKSVAGEAGVAHTAAASEETKARYVRVRVDNGQSICVAEIEVYGWLAPEKTNDNFSDVEGGAEFISASKMVTTLDIMDSVSDDVFGINNLVTREEMAKIVARMFNCGEPVKADTIFNDVDNTNDYSGYIEYCYIQGIISSAEKFRPHDYITGIEASVMILRALGYDTYSPFSGIWTDPAKLALNKMKLLKNTDFSFDAPINKLNVMMLVYNAMQTNILRVDLNGKLITKDKNTLLSERFDMIYGDGIITANPYSSLTSKISEAENSIHVDGVYYKDLTGNAFKHLGERINYLIDSENDTIVDFWVNTDDCKILTVKSEDIISSDKNALKYYDDSDKQRTANYNTEVDFIKNGVASGNYKATDLKKVGGKLVLIDNNDDGTYDVIKLYEPQIYANKMLEYDGETLIIKGYNGEELTISDADKIVVTKNGAKSDIEAIANNSVIYAYVSDDRQYVELEVFQNDVVGVIDECSENSFTIGGKEYTYSDYYTENSSSMPEPVCGLKADFLLNGDDELVWIIDDDTLLNEEKMGVILKTSFDNLSNTKFMMYTENGKIDILTAANKLTVDGNRKSGNLSNMSSDYFNGMIAKYKLNKQGELILLDTARYDSSSEPESVIRSSVKWKLNDGDLSAFDGFYDSSSQKVLNVYTDFPVFTIPRDSATGEILTGEKYIDSYGYNGIRSLYPGIGNRVTGEFEFFGDDNDDSPFVCLRKIDISSYRTAGGMKNYTSNNCMVVEELSRVLYNEDVAYRISGYDFASGNSVSVIAPPDMESVIDSYKVYSEKYAGTLPTSVAFTGLGYVSVDNSSDLTSYMSSIGNMEKGDIIRYESNSGVLSGLERLYSVKDNFFNSYSGNLINTGDNFGQMYRAGFRAYFGMITKITGDVIEITFSDGSVQGFNYTSSNIRKIAVIDDEVKFTDVKNLYGYADYGNKAFVVCCSSRPTYLAVLKNN